MSLNWIVGLYVSLGFSRIHTQKLNLRRTCGCLGSPVSLRIIALPPPQILRLVCDVLVFSLTLYRAYVQKRSFTGFSSSLIQRMVQDGAWLIAMTILFSNETFRRDVLWVRSWFL
jgi:hypothetical protein